MEGLWECEDNLQNQFSPPATLVLGIKLKSSGLVANTFTLWALLPLLTFKKHITPNGTKHKLEQDIFQYVLSKKGKTEKAAEMHFLICTCVSVLHRQSQKLKGENISKAKNANMWTQILQGPTNPSIFCSWYCHTDAHLKCSFYIKTERARLAWGQQSVYTDMAEPNHTGMLWKSKRGTQYGRERAEEVLRRIQAHTETFQNTANFVSFRKQFRPLGC